MVTQELFIVALGVLTAVSGVAVVMMAMRERRAREMKRLAAEKAAAARRLAPTCTAGATKRKIDAHLSDFGRPFTFNEEPPEEDADAAKICPACGSRYRSHYRFCQRDNSELAALN
jgi:hypothetical protein